MQTAQAVETRLPQTRTIKHGQYDLRPIADDDVFDVAFAIDQYSDLSPDLVRDFGQLPRQFRRDDFGGRNATLVKFFQPFELIGFESEYFAFDMWDSFFLLPINLAR